MVIISQHVFLWYSSHKVGFGPIGIDRWFGVTEPSRSAVTLYYPFCQNGNDYNSNQQQNTSSLSFCKIKILFHVNIPKKYRYIKIQYICRIRCMWNFLNTISYIRFRIPVSCCIVILVQNSF